MISMKHFNSTYRIDNFEGRDRHYRHYLSKARTSWDICDTVCRGLASELTLLFLSVMS